jgi:hypothetical protein
LKILLRFNSAAARQNIPLFRQFSVFAWKMLAGIKKGGQFYNPKYEHKSPSEVPLKGKNPLPDDIVEGENATNQLVSEVMARLHDLTQSRANFPGKAVAYVILRSLYPTASAATLGGWLVCSRSQIHRFARHYFKGTILEDHKVMESWGINQPLSAKLWRRIVLSAKKGARKLKGNASARTLGHGAQHLKRVLSRIDSRALELTNPEPWLGSKSKKVKINVLAPGDASKSKFIRKEAMAAGKIVAIEALALAIFIHAAASDPRGIRARS